MSETEDKVSPEPNEVTLPEYARPAGESLGVRTNPFGAHGSGDTSGYSLLQREVRMPSQSPLPYGGWFDDCVQYLEEDLRSAGLDPQKVIERVVVDHSELTIHVAREHIVAVARALRDDQDLRFEMCFGVSGVHYPHDTGHELHAVYHFMSVTHNRNLRLETSAPEEDPKIPSIVDIYPGNNWHERETFDMFGIIFTGHPALTRSLLPDDWVGHPQRKDYPLGGIPVQFKGGTVPPADTRRSYS